MKINLYISSNVILFAIFLTSCASPRHSSWPVQTYGHECGPVMMKPMDPWCLMDSPKYRGEFAACRQSVENYITALNNWYTCTMDDLTDRYNDYLDQSKKTLSCLSEKLTEKSNFDLVVDCSPVEITIDRHYVLISHDTPPFCIAKKQFFPKNNSWDLENCEDEVLNYKKKTRRQIESASIDLEFDIRNASDAAIRKYNCYAEGNDFCI